MSRFDDAPVWKKADHQWRALLRTPAVRRRLEHVANATDQWQGKYLTRLWRDSDHQRIDEFIQKYLELPPTSETREALWIVLGREQAWKTGTKGAARYLHVAVRHTAKRLCRDREMAEPLERLGEYRRVAVADAEDGGASLFGAVGQHGRRLKVRGRCRRDGAAVDLFQASDDAPVIDLADPAFRRLLSRPQKEYFALLEDGYSPVAARDSLGLELKQWKNTHQSLQRKTQRYVRNRLRQR
jgi:hypothetical protein